MSVCNLEYQYVTIIQLKDGHPTPLCDLHCADQNDMVRSNVVIGDEPALNHLMRALIITICLGLRSLKGITFPSVSQRMLR